MKNARRGSSTCFVLARPHQGSTQLIPLSPQNPKAGNKIKEAEKPFALHIICKSEQ